MAIIRHIKVENFRGIRSLDWHVNGRITCLVGPGDSCKITILDAIEYALFPRWNVAFADTDFYQGSTTTTAGPIVIELTIGELPDELVDENKYGLFSRGYDPAGGIQDDPDDACEQVLTYRFQVDQDLQPQWTLVKTSNPDPKVVSYRDRENLGVARLGDDVERHLTWGRGSALTRLTEKESATGAVAIAHRAARAAISSTPLNELQQVAARVQQTVSEFGVSVVALRPGLDLEGTTFGQAAISLHDGNIPLRATGLGTRRLATLAVQQTGLGAKSLVLIDEVEHGLEPHRIRHLLKKICDDHRLSISRPMPEGQVIMTTHSPTPIMALDIAEVRFVHCYEGNITVLRADPASTESLQAIARTVPHAFLARRLLVCEGKTEEALCRVLDEVWSKNHRDLPMAYCGVAAIFGGGSKAPSVALELRRLNYGVLYCGDSDTSLNPDEPTLCSHGVEVVLWPGNVATEERVALDLPFGSLQCLVDTAIQIFGEQEVLNAISSVTDADIKLWGVFLTDWQSNGMPEEAIRTAIGTAAKKTLGGGWFKNITAGMQLGQVVADAIPQVPTSPLATTLKRIEDWVHGT